MLFPWPTDFFSYFKLPNRGNPISSVHVFKLGQATDLPTLVMAQNEDTSIVTEGRK